MARNPRWRFGLVWADFRECQNPLRHPSVAPPSALLLTPGPSNDSNLSDRLFIVPRRWTAW